MIITTRKDGRYVVDKPVCDSDIKVELSLHEINDMLESLHEAKKRIKLAILVGLGTNGQLWLSLKGVRHVIGILDSKKPIQG